METFHFIPVKTPETGGDLSLDDIIFETFELFSSSSSPEEISIETSFSI